MKRTMKFVRSKKRKENAYDIDCHHGIHSERCEDSDHGCLWSWENESDTHHSSWGDHLRDLSRIGLAVGKRSYPLGPDTGLRSLYVQGPEGGIRDAC